MECLSPLTFYTYEGNEMKEINLSNPQLFSEIVSYLEDAVTRPYARDVEVKNYTDLAEVLNHKGYRNSRGNLLTKNTIAVCINRTKNKEDYYPEEVFTQANMVFHLPTIEDNRPTKSDIDLERFTYAVINNNRSHFYGEKCYA